MPTYLLTWNPKRWHWNDEEYHSEVTATRKGELVKSQWSCGNTKRIVPGDRVFLLRQGSERGIIGSGYATSEVFQDEHWDRSRRGKLALYVEYQSETLLEVAQRLPTERHEAARLGVPWHNLVASGVSVPEEHCDKLEKLWKEHLVEVGRQLTTSASSTKRQRLRL